MLTELTIFVKIFRMNIFIAIFIGGGLGSVTRYGMSKLITGNFQHINPMATLASNFISTLILGVVLFFASEKLQMPSTVKAMIVVGFCGGFSTFSTFSYETFELLRNGNYMYAIGNIVISFGLIVGMLFVMARNIK